MVATTARNNGLSVIDRRIVEALARERLPGLTK